MTHAGHGTVIKSLAAGVPVVAMPLGRDQLDNAARVAHHGAGLKLKPKASSDAIARAVRRVLDEPSFRANAERLAAAIASETARTWQRRSWRSSRSTRGARLRRRSDRYTRPLP